MQGSGRIYETDTDNLKYVVKQMYDKLDIALNAYNSMKNSISAIDAAWSGDAHDVFMEKMEELRERLLSVIKDCRSYTDDMKAVCEEYDKTDDEIGQIVAALSF